MNDSRAELGQHEVAVGRPLNPRTTVEQSRSTSGRTRGRSIRDCRSEHGRL